MPRCECWVAFADFVLGAIFSYCAYWNRLHNTRIANVIAMNLDEWCCLPQYKHTHFNFYVFDCDAHIKSRLISIEAQSLLSFYIYWCGTDYTSGGLGGWCSTQSTPSLHLPLVNGWLRASMMGTCGHTGSLHSSVSHHIVATLYHRWTSAAGSQWLVFLVLDKFLLCISIPKIFSIGNVQRSHCCMYHTLISEPITWSIVKPRIRWTDSPTPIVLNPGFLLIAISCLPKRVEAIGVDKRCTNVSGKHCQSSTQTVGWLKWSTKLSSSSSIQAGRVMQGPFIA